MLGSRSSTNKVSVAQTARPRSVLIDGWVRPNGNIIVQADGSYNRFDRGVHRHKFEKIKQHYAVGCDTKSRMLTSQEINRLAPVFVETLGSIVGTLGERAIDIISRKGRLLKAQQVELLLDSLGGSRIAEKETQQATSL